MFDSQRLSSYQADDWQALRKNCAGTGTAKEGIAPGQAFESRLASTRSINSCSFTTCSKNECTDYSHACDACWFRRSQHLHWGMCYDTTHKVSVDHCRQGQVGPDPQWPRLPQGALKPHTFGKLRAQSWSSTSLQPYCLEHKAKKPASSCQQADCSAKRRTLTTNANRIALPVQPDPLVLMRSLHEGPFA